MHTVKEQVEYLREFVTDYKNDLFRRLIAERTSYVTMVLEDFYQQHNCSAVLRSCDCFGIQNVHVIENTNSFTDNSEISMGAADWLTVHRHRKRENNTVETIEMLKSQGYRIVATTPHERDTFIDDIDLHRGKMAFFMGTELTGLSDDEMCIRDRFINDIEGYSIKVDKIDKKSGMMYNMLIYNHTDRKGNYEMTIADSGIMEADPTGRFMEVELYHGYTYTCLLYTSRCV